MKEYIEREAAINELKCLPEQGELDYLGVFDCIKSVLVADVEPVRHGKWLDEGSFDAHYQPIYRCSECNKTVADYYISCHKFCLHCGTCMDGGIK